MRLALLHYTSPPVTGGVEAVLGAQARVLREAGHEVMVVTGHGAGEVVPEIDSRHPEVEALAGLLAAGQSAPDAFEDLRRRLAGRLGPLLAGRDVVIAHNVMTMPFNLPLAAALVDLGRPLLAWTHDLAWVNDRYLPFRRPGRPFSILHEAQPGVTYVAISAARQAEVCACLGLEAGAVAVVPNGIDPAGFLGLSPQTLDLAERGGFAGPGPLVLVPVRVTRRKRIELAIEAAAELRLRHPGLRLVVSGPLGAHDAGNLAYADELRTLTSRLGLDESVRFLHHLAGPGDDHPVPDRVMAELYRMADCVLLPSESEGFGLPLLEAALARAPVVCAALPVLREVGEDAPYTFATAAGPGAVATAVAAALDGRAARFRRRVSEQYGWRSVLLRTEAVIGAARGG